MGSSLNAVRHVDEKKESAIDKGTDRVRLQSLLLAAVVVAWVGGDYE